MMKFIRTLKIITIIKKEYSHKERNLGYSNSQEKSLVNQSYVNDAKFYRFWSDVMLVNTFGNGPVNRFPRKDLHMCPLNQQRHQSLVNG